MLVLEIKLEVGRRIAEARIARGLTQDQVAHALDVAHKSVVSAWECGLRSPSLDMLVRIAHVLGVDPGEWLRGL